MNLNQNLNFLLNKYQINKNDYIIPISNFKYIYDKENIIEKENNNYNDLSCPICYNILKEPKSCNSNKNSHSFCKDCIDTYLQNHDNCPLCKNNFEYKVKEDIQKNLNSLSFKCIYSKEGCNKILNYLEYFNHIEKCEHKKIIYECQNYKFNFLLKSFHICQYRGTLQEVEQHFKLCAFFEFKCIICNKNILGINLMDHIKEKCKFNVYNILFYKKETYIGEMKNYMKKGYGICYVNGKKYEGIWDNDSLEGIGIKTAENGMKYEGEFKNYLKDGYGIQYYPEGDKLYEGQWENGYMNGYGIFYNKSEEAIYEGEFKNNKIEGYGMYKKSNGEIYIGQWENNGKNGYGIQYYKLIEGYYKGEWKNGKIEGYGIAYDAQKKMKYIGEFKNGIYNGYIVIEYSDGSLFEGEIIYKEKKAFGIFKYGDGDKYEGEFNEELLMNGYGIFYYSNGEKYEGEFKNGDREGFCVLYNSNGDEAYIGEFKDDDIA